MKAGHVTTKSLGVYGRFCNQAWQIAGILGIGRANNLEPVFPLWRNVDHKERFGSNEDIDIYKHLVHALPGIPDGLVFRDRNVDWGFYDVRLSPGNWNLTGHFQSPRYFSHCIDTVRHYLTFRDEPPQSDYVAIHYRAGDYSEGPDSYHPRMPMSYYKQAMRLFPGRKFLVFSDELETARNLFGEGVEYSDGDYLEDFKRMKTCSDFIIANSSYSAMAAVLGESPDKRVVAPRPWFGKSAGISGEDIYSEGWTVLNWNQERIAA